MNQKTQSSAATPCDKSRPLKQRTLTDKQRKFMRAVTTITPITICAQGCDAAERGEPQGRANFYLARTPVYTLFLVAYLSREEELKFEALASSVIEKAKSDGGAA